MIKRTSKSMQAPCPSYLQWMKKDDIGNETTTNHMHSGNQQQQELGQGKVVAPGSSVLSFSLTSPPQHHPCKSPYSLIT